MLDQSGPVAVRNAVALDHAGLDVRGLDGQRVGLPLAGRESFPGVGGVFGRMGTPVHPNGSGHAGYGTVVNLEGDQFLRGVAHDLRDAEVVAADAVDGGLLRRLVLAQRQNRGIPGVGPQTRRFVDGEPRIISDFRPGRINAMHDVFVDLPGPLAGKIDLAQDRWRGQQRGAQQMRKASRHFFLPKGT